MQIEAAKSHMIDLIAKGEYTGAREVRAWVWIALAKLVRGNDIRGVVECLDNGLDAPNMFSVPGYIRVLIRHREQLPADSVQRIEEMLTNRMSYSGLYDSIHTENHKVMLATTRLLVAQEFPDRRIDGTRASVAYQATLDWLRAWGESRCIYGHVEFHSPVYFMTYMMPLLNLRDCATDPDVRHMAEMMIDYFALQHAVSHLDGMYAGGHSRTYDHLRVHTRASLAQLWSFMFFREDQVEMPNAALMAFTTADSDYVPPSPITRAALDRTNAHEVRERHAEVVSNGVSVDIQRYTWMTDSFALSSLQGASWPDHQSRWSLKIAGANPHSVIFTNHRRNSEKWGYWHGASEHEHLLQHKGAIIASYRIPDGDSYPEIHGHLPYEADEWLTDPSVFAFDTEPDWFFLRVEGTYVAIRPLAPFRIEERMYEGPMIEDAPFAGDRYREFISKGVLSGVIIEAACVTDWQSLDDFADAVRNSQPDIDVTSGTVRYQTLDGTLLELVNPGTQEGAESFADADGVVPSVQSHNHYRAQRPQARFSIEGETPDFTDWPSLGAPSANSEFGSGVYTVGEPGDGIKLDFRNWTREDL
jgi:hypothetical protein